MRSFLAHVFRNSTIMDEIMRKTVHIVFGLGITAMIFFLERDLAITFLSLGLFVGAILSDAVTNGHPVPLISYLIKSLERKDVLPGKGALYFALSSLFCLIVFPKPVVIPAVLTLTLLDGMATIVGIRFGKQRIWKNKTSEGLFAGIAVAFFALLLFVGPLQAFIVAVVAGVVELLSPVDDNLLIPVAVCIMLTLMGMV
jgi:phytol kinase